MSVSNKQENQGQGKLWFRRIMAVIKNNWGWKLGCLLLSVFLWGGLIMQDTSLLRTKTFNDVTINVVNSDLLLRNGYIVVSGLEPEALSGVRMRVEVPQRNYDMVQASNYSVRVDLSRIRSAGKQSLPVLSTNSTAYGNVVDISVNSIEVTVEEFVTRSRIPVRIATVGSLPEGVYGAAATADPIYVEIAGPRSQVETVARCVARYDLSQLSQYIGTERTAVPFVLEDRQENEVPLDSIIVSPLNSGVQIDTITVEQALYELMSVPVDVDTLITGTVTEGYMLKSVTVEPAVIKMAFSEQTDVSGIKTVRVTAPADISGITETRTFSLPIVRPADAKYLGVTAVQVTVELSTIEEADTESQAEAAEPDALSADEEPVTEQ